MKNRTNRRYDESFILEAIQYYYESGESVYSISRKYGLSSHSVFLYWLKRYPIDSQKLSLSEEVKIQYMEEEKSQDPTSEKSLNQRIIALDKALEYSKLRVRSMEVLIEVAEKNEGIDIRKKTGAKQ